MKKTKEVKKAKKIKKAKEAKEAKKKKAKKATARLAPSHIVIKKSDNKEAKWYVVHTYSGHEVKVAQTLKQRVESMKLEDHVLELLIPTQSKIQIRHGEKKKIKEKIFPGYLMVKMVLTDESWLTVRTTPGITSFVGIANRPTPLPKQEVETILKYTKMKAPKYKAGFTIGEAVKITDGPFADFLGSVDNIDEEKGKVRILVSIFGRETPVELDFLQVEKI